MSKRQHRKRQRREAPKKVKPPIESQDRAIVTEKLTEFDPTRGYKGRLWYSGRNEIIEELPFFRLWHAALMLSDPIVRQSLNARDAALSALKIEVKSRNEELKKFIGDQWETLWGKFGHDLLKTKRFGYGGYQVGYTTDKATNRVVIDGLKHFAPQDCRPAVQGGETVGIFVRSGSTDSILEGPILNPRALWTSFDAEFGVRYGRSILKRSYGPWWEKWMDHGSKKTTQLRMIKDAYRGDMFFVDATMTVTLPDGTKMLWRDIFREAAENMMNGSTAIIPVIRDGDGNKNVDYEKPSDTGNPTAIWTWGDNMDRDIRAGMDVTEEIIMAASSGSGFSGRAIPFIMFLQACMVEAMELLKAIDKQVLRPLAWLNFGNDPEYTIKAMPLMETFAESVAGSEMGGQALGGGGQGNPQPGQPQQQPPPPPPNGQPPQPQQQPPQNGNQPPQFARR